MKSKIIIAIDGYSSSGKSSMAKELAKQIGYAYIDTGAMYRAVTLYALENSIISTNCEIDKKTLIESLDKIDITFRVVESGETSHTFLNGIDVENEIRSMRVSNLVSPISTIKEVRRSLVEKQQSYGVEKGIVMDGRDIGTTVFPNAEMKVFVDASPEVRAKRRFKELTEKGVTVEYNDVYTNICERDHIDQTREESPLRKADDAIVLNNDNMSIEQQNKWLLDLYENIVNKQ